MTVFYVTSHGSAGDHWFDWFAKALNAHPEIMIYMGDTVRAKYLKERSRKDRADIFAFTQFLTDLGAVYKAIGECYAYRAYQLVPLLERYKGAIGVVNIVRHPYCWLDFYVDWRCSNMNMPKENLEGVDHEWSVVCHEEIRDFGLLPYERKDVHIWAAYQGMMILNRMISDSRPGIRNVPLEHIVADPSLFQEIVSDLTQGQVLFETPLMDHLYSWLKTPFLDTRNIRSSPERAYEKWPKWKKEAFQKIVTPEVREMFQSFGYTF